jgi:sulfate transport system substrate-binding protein
VDKRGTRAVAEAYLKLLYTPEAQELAAKHYYRPTDEAILKKNAETFKELKLFKLDEVFGNWDKAQAAHFDDGGSFDQVYKPGK